MNEEGEFKKRVNALLVHDEDNHLFATIANKKDVLKIVDEAHKDFYQSFKFVKVGNERLIMGSKEMYECILKWFGEEKK